MITVELRKLAIFAAEVAALEVAGRVPHRPAGTS
jgi:hypothetical protein